MRFWVGYININSVDKKYATLLTQIGYYVAKAHQSKPPFVSTCL